MDGTIVFLDSFVNKEFSMVINDIDMITYDSYIKMLQEAGFSKTDTSPETGKDVKGYFTGLSSNHEKVDVKLPDTGKGF